MKKQSFKKRKQKGGSDTEEKKQEPVEQEKQEESVVDTEEQTTGSDKTQTTEPIVDTKEQMTGSDTQTTEPIVDTKEQMTGSDTQGDSDTKNEPTTPPSVEELQNQPLTTEDENALKQVNDLDPEEIDKLAQQIANNPDAPIPPWARAVIKSGAVGPLVNYLNKNPDIKKALEQRVMDAIQNSGPGGPVGDAGPPGTNTQETSGSNNLPEQDENYKAYLELLKTDPDNTIRKKVYLWASLESIFIWNEETKQWQDNRQKYVENEDTESNTPQETVAEEASNQSGDKSE